MGCLIYSNAANVAIMLSLNKGSDLIDNISILGKIRGNTKFISYESSNLRKRAVQKPIEKQLGLTIIKYKCPDFNDLKSAKSKEE